MKMKKIAKGNENSIIQQAQELTINNGLNSTDVVALSARTAKNEIENIPTISNKEIDEMLNNNFDSHQVAIIKPTDWKISENMRSYSVLTDENKIDCMSKAETFINAESLKEKANCLVNTWESTTVKIDLKAGI